MHLCSTHLLLASSFARAFNFSRDWKIHNNNCEHITSKLKCLLFSLLDSCLAVLSESGLGNKHQHHQQICEGTHEAAIFGPKLNMRNGVAISWSLCPFIFESYPTMWRTTCKVQHVIIPNTHPPSFSCDIFQWSSFVFSLLFGSLVCSFKPCPVSTRCFNYIM